MAGSTPSAASPGVHAKGVHSVKLLLQRQQLARWDVWPFFVLYFGVASTAIYYATSYQW
jgi:hypothetical protein